MTHYGILIFESQFNLLKRNRLIFLLIWTPPYSQPGNFGDIVLYPAATL